MFQIATSDNKLIVDNSSFHETYKKIRKDYSVVYEMVVGIFLGAQKQKTAISFQNVEHYESYINNFDMDYDADDTIQNCYFFELITLEINKLGTAENGQGFDFKQDTVEVIGKMFYFPTGGYIPILLLLVFYEKLYFCDRSKAINKYSPIF